MLVNKTFDELTVGQRVKVTREITDNMVQLFALLSGDINPLHLDEQFAKASALEDRAAHGMLIGALVSAAITTDLPGPGSIYLNQSLRFIAPVRIGDVVVIELRVIKKNEDNHSVRLQCNIRDAQGRPLVTGQAEVIAPLTKHRIDSAVLPVISAEQLKSFSNHSLEEAVTEL